MVQQQAVLGVTRHYYGGVLVVRTVRKKPDIKATVPVVSIAPQSAETTQKET